MELNQEQAMIDEILTSDEPETPSPSEEGTEQAPSSEPTTSLQDGDATEEGDKEGSDAETTPAPETPSV